MFQRHLRPGDPWEVVVDATGGCRLSLQVVDKEGSLPNPLLVAVWTGNGFRMTRRVSETGSAELTRLHPGRFKLQLYDETSQTLAAESGVFDDTCHASLRIELQEPWRFRVINSEEQALPGTSIWFDVVDGSGRTFYAIADANGEALVRGLPDDHVVAHLQHATYGARPRIPIEPPSNADEAIVLELRADEALRVALMDGNEPAVGVTCELRVHASTYYIGQRKATDESGRVDWESLGHGEYDVLSSHPDYWPVEVKLETIAERQIVPIRRRGALEIDVDSPSGAQEGLRLELMSTEFGADVREWVQAGLVEAAPPSLETDAEGRIVVDGLPRGRYEWRLVGGEVVQGAADVPPGSTASQVVLVP